MGGISRSINGRERPPIRPDALHAPDVERREQFAALADAGGSAGNAARHG